MVKEMMTLVSEGSCSSCGSVNMNINESIK